VILRADLLAGRAIAVGGAVRAAVPERLAALGARVEPMPGERKPAEDGEWARARAPLDAVVYDASAGFGDPVAPAEAALLAALERAWVAVREVATGALILGEAAEAVGGRVLLVGPRSDAGPFAQAARAALENLARTLSVEWARHGVTTAMIAPGPASTDEQLAELICFLVSEAGGYVSGCRLDVGRFPGELWRWTPLYAT
jgi:NAD(P)-dependent dehydrogenase (short-subunit alcohol dehydrogenase family)